MASHWKGARSTISHNKTWGPCRSAHPRFRTFTFGRITSGLPAIRPKLPERDLGTVSVGTSAVSDVYFRADRFARNTFVQWPCSRGLMRIYAISSVGAKPALHLRNCPACFAPLPYVWSVPAMGSCPQARVSGSKTHRNSGDEYTHQPAELRGVVFGAESSSRLVRERAPEDVIEATGKTARSPRRCGCSPALRPRDATRCGL